MAEIRISLTEQQQVLKKAVYELCKLYPSEYWRELDETRTYPKPSCKSSPRRATYRR